MLLLPFQCCPLGGNICLRTAGDGSESGEIVVVGAGARWLLSERDSKRDTPCVASPSLTKLAEKPPFPLPQRLLQETTHCRSETSGAGTPRSHLLQMPSFFQDAGHTVHLVQIVKDGISSQRRSERRQRESAKSEVTIRNKQECL